MRIVTVTELKAQALAAKVAAVDTLCAELAAKAAQLGGRYWLYGSAARGDLHRDSDIDLLLDFPDEDTTQAAQEAAELACARLKLEYDITPIGWCREPFLAHVMKDARALA